MTVPLVKLPLVAKRLVELASVKMAVLGVVLPMGVSLMVPPLMVRLLATFSSCNVPVMEPKSPKDRVTAPLPSVPELTALALTLPVLSMVRLFETMASVTELLGKVRLPVTARLVVLVLVPVALVQVRLERVSGLVMVRLSMVALVAYRLVEVELVNTPVDGEAEPIDVLSIVPPEMVASEDERFEAFNVEMVPDVELRLVTVPLVMIPLVALKFVAKRLVEVVLVPVALFQVTLFKDAWPLDVRSLVVSKPVKKSPVPVA